MTMTFSVTIALLIYLGTIILISYYYDWREIDRIKKDDELIIKLKHKMEKESEYNDKLHKKNIELDFQNQECKQLYHNMLQENLRLQRELCEVITFGHKNS